MSLTFTAVAQDTTVVALARDGLAVVSAWTMVGMGLAFLAILVVLLLVLAELRMLSRTWSGFLATTTERSQSLLEHANSAARNLNHVTSVVRAEIDRLNGLIEGVTDDIGEASVEVRRRIADLSALLDLAQSEAEDAVLDAAAKLRMLRKGAGLLAKVGGLGGGAGAGGHEDGHAEAPAAAGGDAGRGTADGGGDAGNLGESVEGEEGMTTGVDIKDNDS